MRPVNKQKTAEATHARIYYKRPVIDFAVRLLILASYLPWRCSHTRKQDLQP